MIAPIKQSPAFWNRKAGDNYPSILLMLSYQLLSIETFP